MVMSFAQVLASLQGKLEADENKVKEAVDFIKKHHPAADLRIRDNRTFVGGYAKEVNGIPCCMNCGHPMTDRVNQYFKGGKWVQKVKKDNLSNWECENCAPGRGSQPLMIGWNTAKEAKLPNED
jgi:hypothetical protein